MKKSIWILFAAGLFVVMMLSACTKAGNIIYVPDPDEPMASTAPIVTVIYGQDGLGDRSYNDLIYLGVEEAATEYGLRTVELSPTSYEEGRGYLENMFQTVKSNRDTIPHLYIVAAAGYDDYIRKNSSVFDSNPYADLLYLETPEPLASGGYYYGVGSDYNFDGGAGIGSGIHSKLESVNIYGGNVIALGGHKAPGIGARGDSGEVNIYGGHVKAGGGQNGAGIGGGENGDSGDITITGGTVRAYGNKQIVSWESFDKVTIGNNSGYGAGIGSGQDGSVNTIIIKGGDIEAYGGEDAAGIGTGEEFTKDGINSGTIEIHGGKVWAEGGGYGAGIGAGEDATFGVLGISGGRVDAHAGEDCYPWSGGIGACHDDHEDGCHIGWAGWERIYIGKGMRLWTYSPNVGGVENVTNNLSWWDFVHQRPQVAFGECDHAGYTEDTCPFCYRTTLQLR